MSCKKMFLSSLAVVFVAFAITVFTAGVSYGMNHSGNITSNVTWHVTDSPHIVTGTIEVANGATLTISPGCLVKFDAGQGLNIGRLGAGSLNATGTSGNPITFTSNAATPSPGDWQGIVFFGGTVNASTILDYCTVEYGGNGSYHSDIYCQSASPTIKNCTIRNSSQHGIYCNDGSAPTLTNNTINNNGSFPISLFCNNLDTNVTGNTGSGNTPDAIEVRGANITASHTWVVQDFYFKVTGNIEVANGATLTISPGCLVKFDAGQGLNIGRLGAGSLNATGTSGNPITFTSNAATPSPGDWLGIVFFGSTVNASTILAYCTVEYGGNYYNSDIYCYYVSPTIQHCIIKNSSGYGIYTTGSGAKPSITCSDIVSNNHGVYAASNSNPIISGCKIAGNTSSGVTNTTLAITIDAKNNWWGNSNGPGGVGPGTGDKVSKYVDYTSWLTAFDSCLSTIVLSPSSAINPLGTTHTVTATVKDDASNPIDGMVLSFNIISGPHAGQNGTATTYSNGQAEFTYTGTAVGTDTINASFVDFHGRTVTSSAVTKTWVSTPPTAIKLIEFRAKKAKTGAVILKWRTATEVDNAGFNIYRSEEGDGNYLQVNNAIIPAKGSATLGAQYRYEDTPDKGRYYYKLEDVDYHGERTMHGPVKLKDTTKN